MRSHWYGFSDGIMESHGRYYLRRGATHAPLIPLSSSLFTSDTTFSLKLICLMKMGE
jgi:hypothetical protein